MEVPSEIIGRANLLYLYPKIDILAGPICNIGHRQLINALTVIARDRVAIAIGIVPVDCGVPQMNVIR